VTSIRHANAYKQGIAKSRLAIIEKCGHEPFLEKPAETAKVIVSFLEE